MASSTIDNSNAEGSSLANLVVNGVEVSDPEPNTRLDLPDVGYVVLNEQIATAGGMTVNMIDRKSTRLNSSHSQISYAVFCLKKKKKKKSVKPQLFDNNTTTFLRAQYSP